MDDRGRSSRAAPPRPADPPDDADADADADADEGTPEAGTTGGPSGTARSTEGAARAVAAAALAADHPVLADDDPARTSVRRLVWRVHVTAAIAVAATNVLGVVAVFVFAAVVLPGETIPDDPSILRTNLVLTAIWSPLAIALGTALGARILHPARRWLTEGRAPTEEEALAVLRAPLRLFRSQMLLWVLSAAGFAAINGLMSPRLIPRVLFTVVLGGLSTSVISYLITERLLRPFAARALDESHLSRPRLPGVTLRNMLTWGLGTGVPVVGMLITGIYSLAEDQASRVSLSITMIVLSATAIVVGSWTTFLAARAIGDPVRSVRDGLRSVEEGDLDVDIPVYDGSELGLLQAGFNQMVGGLRERERIRDLFGRHVGEDVAAEALDREDDGASLGGETRDVAVLFVDIVASTSFAAEAPPTEVVEVLNRFFDVVVRTVDDHGGWINKFQGDAALAVFGAPGERADPAGSALATARALAVRLRREVPDVRAGIGVAAGTVVAGNIGAEERFEYTVIGDPVNEAARLTELAKEVPGGLAASGDAVAAADATEAARWVELRTVRLRGRTRPSVVCVPRLEEGEVAPPPFRPPTDPDAFV